MAKMYPSKIDTNSEIPNSEKKIFKVLAKLPDDYHHRFSRKYKERSIRSGIGQRIRWVSDSARRWEWSEMASWFQVSLASLASFSI